MEDKFKLIKDILKIIISILIIFSITKSCSKAYSLNDFIDFCEQVSEMQDVPASYRRTANRILFNETKVRNALANTNYISYVARVHDSGTIEIYCFGDKRTWQTTNANPPYIYYSGRVTGNLNIGNDNYVRLETNFSGQTWFTYNGTNPAFGLVESSTEITNWYNLVFNNRYSQYTPLEFNQDSLDIVSLNGDLARYIQR